MIIDKFEKYTIITAEQNKFLKVKDSEISIGKPVRIIFDNTDDIPEFEEEDI